MGKKRAGEAKASQIDLKRRWAKEKLRVAAESLVLKLNSFAKIFKITKDEAALADKLAYAERVKFSRGASDLLMVNIREENLAKAQVKYLANFLKYQFIDADVKKVKVEFIAE